MNPLIEKAKGYSLRRKEVTPEEMELALSYARGEITYKQLSYALAGDSKKLGSQAYVFLSRALSQYIRSL